MNMSHNYRAETHSFIKRLFTNMVDHMSGENFRMVFEKNNYYYRLCIITQVLKCKLLITHCLYLYSSNRKNILNKNLYCIMNDTFTLRFTR